MKHLKRFEDVNDLNAALISAVKKNQFIKVVNLIKDGADINTSSDIGTPLIISSFNCYMALVNFFIDSGADLNRQNSGGNTALIYLSVDTDNYDTFKKLLKNGADPNIADELGHTPLIIAAQNDINEVIVEDLIEYGADINHQNNIGDTALIIALSERSYEIIDLLLNLGADYTIKNNIGMDFISYLIKIYNKTFDNILIKYPEIYDEYKLRLEMNKYNL